ncbi:hypothetical protein ACVW0Y_002758 [Pseudomonas sp. TE3786]
MAIKRGCALFLLALAALFLFGFFSSVARTLWFVAHAEVHSATVSDYRNAQRDPQRPPLYVPLLAYQRDGQQVVASAHDSSREKPYAVGEQLSIYVDPNAPERAMIRSLSSLLSTPLFALLMAYIFAWGSGVIHRSLPAMPEQQSGGKVDAFYARYGHYLKPTTLILILLFLPLLAFVSVFTFLAPRLIPSLRRSKRDSEALVKALETNGFFKLEHQPLPLPAFKKHIQQYYALHLADYRVCNSGTGTFAERVQSMAAWFGRRGIDLNVRVGKQPGELHYGENGVLRLHGLDDEGGQDVDVRQIDLALARLFNRWLIQLGRPERLYVPFPYGEMVMLSEALHRVLLESPVFPRERVPLSVGSEGENNIARLAKAQEHPLAWRYHRLFKLNGDTLGGLTGENFATQLQQQLSAGGIHVGAALGETPQGRIYALNGIDTVATEPQLLLYVLTAEAYARADTIPDLARHHGKPASQGLLLPTPRQVSADNRLVYSENGSAIDLLDLNTQTISRIAEPDECRSYMDMTLDESGRWLLYWYINEDLDFPMMTLHDLHTHRSTEVDYRPLIDYRFDTLRWQQAPTLFSMNNQLTESQDDWRLDPASGELEAVAIEEASV